MIAPVNSPIIHARISGDRTQITTPGIADTAGGFVYSVADELASVDMDFHIRVLCGCGGFDPDKRIFKVFNEDVVDFKARLP